MVDAMASLVVQAVRKVDLPSWLLLREMSSWSGHAEHTTATRGRLQGFLGAKTKAVIPGAAHGSAVPDIEHAESARWLRLLRWTACSDFGLRGKPLRTGYSCAWIQPPLVPFRRLHGAQGHSAGDFLTAVPR